MQWSNHEVVQNSTSAAGVLSSFRLFYFFSETPTLLLQASAFG